jgi:hypothetical protein
VSTEPGVAGAPDGGDAPSEHPSHVPWGRFRHIGSVVLVTAAAVIVLRQVSRWAPAFAGLLAPAVVVIVVLGLIVLIRGLVPRREQRRHAERRKHSERRHRDT